MPLRYLGLLGIALPLLTACSSPELRAAVDRALQRTGGRSPAALTQTEIVAGLKEALTVGATNAATSLNVTDAFFKSALRIPFPPKAAVVESTLRKIGAGNIADDVILSLNRAAEDAAVKSKPIFVEAIRAMTISDALAILRGNRSAATDYLRSKTLDKLTAAFRAPIKGSLDKVGATRFWGDAMGAYNRVPFVERVDPDLTAFVTVKALDGLFSVVGEEEAKIRANPIARTTDLLRRVFGAPEARSGTAQSSRSSPDTTHRDRPPQVSFRISQMTCG